jgi:hypothetical protein
MGYNLQGVCGVTGPIGVTGQQGISGIAGVTGIVGPKGQNGQRGFSSSDEYRIFLEEQKRKKLLEERILKIDKLRSKWEQ